MKKIIVLLTFAFVLSGCSDGIEPETLGYVVAIGIDMPKENEEGYNITLQFANPAKISGGSSEEGGKTGSDSVDNITVLAPGIYPAVNIANHIISKKFVLSHTKLIVFSDEIAKAGIGDFLEAIGRSSDIRPNTYFAVSKGEAKEFLEAVNPETEVNPVRYYTMIFENDYSGFIPQNKSQDFYFYFDSEEKDAVMPICSVKKDEKAPLPDNDRYQMEIPDYTAGEIPTNSEEIQVMGTAVFNGDTKIHELGDIETEIYNLLTGRYKNSYVSYYFSKTPDTPITVLQKQQRKPKITVDTKSNTPKIKIKVFLEADFSSGTAETAVEDNKEEFAKEASEAVKSQILEFLNTTQSIGTDIVGFGSYSKRTFKTIPEFLKYEWKDKYKFAEFNVEVEFEMRRTGLIIRSD